ncbi:hypothetical protein BV401_40310 [Streptomyces malaysiensis subsp. malaysiensis]|uniref:Transposase InsH N-terminal domain-containing protein n=1 Tax=Streptomyces autolyticus TaxID=75293 RepID=A0ABN4WIT3_9ACTN|nr:hypothetical protein BV401_40310 [Streptomyces autolyticus]
MDVIAPVLVLQMLHDLSDRETAEAVRCDIRWKVACGLPLDHEGFHPTTLTYWRKPPPATGRASRPVGRPGCGPRPWHVRGGALRGTGRNHRRSRGCR